MPEAVIVRTPYGYSDHVHPGTSFDVVKDSKGRVINPEVVSMTNQSDTEACDLNLMFARFSKTGVLVDAISGVERTPVYGDFSEVGDYHALKGRIAAAESAFMLFPASLRNRFDNDVQKLANFLADAKNDVEAVKLGLKDRTVLLTALADDGVTRISPDERKALDDKAAAAAAAGAGASGTGGPSGGPA